MNIGKWGEIAAAKYLTNKGYIIIEENFRCRMGEIDIIATHDDILVFIEVKTRRSLSYGLPGESITETKLHHIKKTINYYILINNLHYRDLRIDVIEILIKNKKAYIHHIENVQL